MKFCAINKNNEFAWIVYCLYSLDLACRAFVGGSAQEKLAWFTSEIELAELAVEQEKGGVFLLVNWARQEGKTVMNDMDGLRECRHVKPRVRRLWCHGCELFSSDNITWKIFLKLEFMDKYTLLFYFPCERRLAEMNFPNQKCIFISKTHFSYCGNWKHATCTRQTLLNESFSSVLGYQLLVEVILLLYSYKRLSCCCFL